MSRLFAISPLLIGVLSVAAMPLHAADKVVVETHVQEGSLTAKSVRAELAKQGPSIRFAARARIAADGSIQYDCDELPSGAARQGKPHVNEEH